jgi:hypothetical protein
MAKIDCSTVVGFVHEAVRLCEMYKDCAECPMTKRKKCPMTLLDYDDLDAQSIVDALQAWSDEHPAKTRLDDLLEKYPQTQLTNINKAPSFKPCAVGYCDNCDKCLKNHAAYYFCWHEPVDGGATGKAVE